MTTPVYPLTGVRFELTADSELGNIFGESLGSFSECSGLSVKVDAVTLHEGGENTFEHQLPGKVSHPPLVLKRGVTKDTALLDWLSSFVEESRVKPRNVRISLTLPNGDPGVSWVAERAYPLKWEGPSLNAGRGEVAIESLELVHQGLRKGS